MPKSDLLKQKTKNPPVIIFIALTGPITALTDRNTEKKRLNYTFSLRI
jgi:hypothetical protein